MSVASLRLAVIAAPLAGYSVRRLSEEIAARGHVAVPVHAHHFTAHGLHGSPSPHAAGKPLHLDGAVHTMSTDTLSGLRALAALGPSLPHLNTAGACRRSADKFETYLALRAAGVPTPTTRRCQSDADLLTAGEAFGWPFVVKPPDGAGGSGVGLVEDPAALMRHTARLRSRTSTLLAQEYIASSFGTDLRIVVVDGRVAASGRRVGAAGEFRSNLAQGGRGIACVPDAEEADVAVRAAAAVGLDIAGVDVLAGVTGPLVVETNSFPAIHDVERLTGNNVAGDIVDSLLARIAAGADGHRLDEPQAASR